MALPEMFQCEQCHTFWSEELLEEYRPPDRGEEEYFDNPICPDCDGLCPPVDSANKPTLEDFIEALHNLMAAEGGEPGTEHVQKIALEASEKLLQRVGVRL